MNIANKSLHITSFGLCITGESMAGDATCITVNGPFGSITFDMGTVTRESIKSHLVFISHRHVDHIGSVYPHFARKLFCTRSSSTYISSSILGNVMTEIHDLNRKHYSKSGSSRPFPHAVCEPGRPFPFKWKGRSFLAKAYSMVHSSTCQGYIIYQLKDGKEIPWVGFTGDCQILDQDNIVIHEDFSKVNTLILECSFINYDYENMRQKTIYGGHTNILDVIKLKDWFKNKRIILFHCSGRYKKDRKEALTHLDERYMWLENARYT